MSMINGLLWQKKKRAQRTKLKYCGLDLHIETLNKLFSIIPICLLPFHI